MKACILRSPAPVQTNPLAFAVVPRPEPGPGQVLVRVQMRRVCRTDLHVVGGELPPAKADVLPGSEVVRLVDEFGEGSARCPLGGRVGMPWLHSTDQTCEYCRACKEDLGDSPTFTGWTVN